MKRTHISPSKFCALAGKYLIAEGREIYASSKAGLLVRASDSSKIHRIGLSTYPVHSMLGPYLPRLDVNATIGPLGLPEKAERMWNLRPLNNPLFRNLNLEITFADEEADLIAAAIPSLIQGIENSVSNDFEGYFPMKFKSTTRTNIWTVAASDIAKESYERNGVFRRFF